MWSVGLSLILIVYPPLVSTSTQTIFWVCASSCFFYFYIKAHTSRELQGLFQVQPKVRVSGCKSMDEKRHTRPAGAQKGLYCSAEI